jgi:hypothetical protein
MIMVQRVHKYADGGKIRKDHMAPPKKPSTAAAKRPDPKMLGAGMAAGAAEALKKTRKKQMEDLGL